MPDPVSDDPQPPDWAIKVVPNPRARQPVGDIEAAKQPTGTQPLDEQRMAQFTSWSQNVAGKDELASGDVTVAGSAVNGTVQTNAVGIAPASAVAVKQTNMLVSQSFTSPNTVVAVGQWSWYGDDGHLSPGCARVDCNGNQDDLVSNEVLVVKDENIAVTVWVKWVELSYTGTGPIVLGIQKYRKGKDPDTGGTVYMDVGGINIDTVTSPAASGDWTKLTGTYIVPARIDQIRFRFSTPNSTQGYVLWDEAVFEKLDLISDNAVPGVGRTVDNVVTKLNGQTGSGFTHDDEAAALAGTAQTLTANASNVSQIQAGSSSGTIAGDEFDYTARVLGHNWAGSDTASYYSADGVSASWTTASYPVNALQVNRYDWIGSGATSSTDYQKIEIVLSSASAYEPWLGTYGSTALYGRISADWTSYIKFIVNGNGTYKLECCVASVLTELVSGSVTNPGAGATITLFCGDKATTTPRKFTAQINGATLAAYTDVGTSNYGASYRKWGWGGEGLFRGAYGFVDPYVRTMSPGSINQWIGVDQ